MTSTITTADILQGDPVFVSSYSNKAFGPYHGFVGTDLASGTYPAVARLSLAPIVVNRQYPIARWWWANGATVGTDRVQAGLYSESLDLVAASPIVLQAGSANTIQFQTPGVSANELASNNSTADQASYAMSSHTYKKGRLYFLVISNTHAASASAVSDISGSSDVVWTQVATTQYNTSLNRVSIWQATPTADFTGILTVNFGGVTQTNFRYSLDTFNHVTSVSPVVQSVTATGNDTTPTVTLAAFGSANNGTFFVQGNATPSTSVPEAGFFELNDNTTAVAHSTNISGGVDLTPSTTITSGQWGAIGVELKSTGTTEIIPPARYWLALLCSGTTATFFTASQNLFRFHAAQAGSFTSGMPQLFAASAFAATSTVLAYGFTRRSTP